MHENLLVINIVKDSYFTTDLIHLWVMTDLTHLWVKYRGTVSLLINHWSFLATVIHLACYY